MQTIDKYNDNLGTGILLSGPPGSGKTVLGCRLFKRTVVQITDPNFASAIRFLKDRGDLENVVGFDTVMTDEEGKKVPVQDWYPRMLSQMTAYEKDPNIDAIFLDGATYMADVIISRISHATSEMRLSIASGKDSFDKWREYLMTWRGLIIQLRQSGKKLIVAAHERKEKDESDGIFKYNIALDGQIRDRIVNMFSDHWRCEIEENMGKHRWMVRTLGNARHELKNNFTLEGYLEQDEVVRRVRKQIYGT